MPTLIINPRSGGGKAARFDLIAQCARRGIEPIVFEPGDHLAALAETAIRNGADAVGMAGGDGSQATVAAAAAEHDVPFVCVPAGTRNHFAFDLGIDRKRCASGSRRAGDEVRTRLSELLLVFGPGVRSLNRTASGYVEYSNAIMLTWLSPGDIIGPWPPKRRPRNERSTRC